MPQCSHCGQDNAADAEFCNNCGKRVASHAEELGPEQAGTDTFHEVDAELELK
jgi:uncharacterized membrane protein YvbJ